MREQHRARKMQRVTEKNTLTQACHSAAAFIRKEDTDVFDANVSVVLAFDELGFTREVVRANDAYGALARAMFEPFLEGEVGIVVTSCGWASPITDKSPSEHPERARCFMCVASNKKGEMASLVEMHGREALEVLDTGPSSGPFADAIARAVLMMSFVSIVETSLDI